MLLQHKVVVISGIGPGLGVALALEAARQGARLVIATRSPANLVQAERRIREECPATEVLSVATDITQRVQCRDLVQATFEKFGRIDALLNSAFNPGKPELIEDSDLEAWHAAMNVNLFGTLNLVLETLPAMKAQRSGAIVNVNTMVTRKPLATQAGYAASKAALASATQHLALECGKYNIRVNSTFMGWMWGASVQQYFRYESKKSGMPVETLKANVEKHIPLGKMPTDAECAKAVIFLASDYACAITGACLDVNGGEYLPH